MSSPTPPTDEGVKTPTAADLFELPKRLKRQVRESTRQVESMSGDSAVYLWIHVNRTGIVPVSNEAEGESGLTLDQWLNVLDEAATLGVSTLVVTLDTPLTARPDVWVICQWAQNNYGMMVDLHPNSAPPGPEEIDPARKLDPRMTRLLVKKEHLSALAHLKEAGIDVWVCNPQPYGEHPRCLGPGKMVFVNDRGALYTCRRVEGNQDYCLGTIFQGAFRSILADPKLAHALADDVHYVSEACDGCPSLTVNFPPPL